MYSTNNEARWRYVTREILYLTVLVHGVVVRSHGWGAEEWRSRYRLLGSRQTTHLIYIYYCTWRQCIDWSSESLSWVDAAVSTAGPVEVDHHRQPPDAIAAAASRITVVAANVRVAHTAPIRAAVAPDEDVDDPSSCTEFPYLLQRFCNEKKTPLFFQRRVPIINDYILVSCTEDSQFTRHRMLGENSTEKQ